MIVPNNHREQSYCIVEISQLSILTLRYVRGVAHLDPFGTSTLFSMGTPFWLYLWVTLALMWREFSGRRDGGPTWPHVANLPSKSDLSTPSASSPSQNRLPHPTCEVPCGPATSVEGASPTCDRRTEKSQLVGQQFSQRRSRLTNLTPDHWLLREGFQRGPIRAEEANRASPLIGPVMRATVYCCRTVDGLCRDVTEVVLGLLVVPNSLSNHDSGGTEHVRRHDLQHPSTSPTRHGTSRLVASHPIFATDRMRGA